MLRRSFENIDTQRSGNFFGCVKKHSETTTTTTTTTHPFDDKADAQHNTFIQPYFIHTSIKKHTTMMERPQISEKNKFEFTWKRHPRPNSSRAAREHGISTLSCLHDHDCLLYILEFLPWQDLNKFSPVSRECRKVRRHPSLDQTRSGTISLGKGAANAIELIDVVREQQWPKAFSKNRTHLRLSGLMHLSSYIEPINDNFIREKVAPLQHVTSLDCSSPETGRRRPWLSPYGDYIDKGFAHGLAISLLVPNLKQIDMSYLPLTLLGIDWLLQNNQNLETIRWNRSVIWPINGDACDHIKSCANIKEIYLEEARILFCDDDWDQEELWTCLAENCQDLKKVSVRGAKYHYKATGTAPIPQESLIRLVRCSPSLRWFCSDLSEDNIAILQKERPTVTFCR
jgi:hypothetical protein